MADRLVMEVKSDDSTAEGTFSGILSTYGNVDGVGDICEPGCFDKSVLQNPKMPLLWQHDAKEPIGSFEVVSTEGALRIAGRINLGVSRGREAHALLKAGDIRGLSIGYAVKLADYDAQGIRHLKEVILDEGSLVTFPANQLAMVTEAKALEVSEMDIDEIRDALSSLTDEQRDEILKQLQAQPEPEAAKEDPVPEDDGTALTEDEAEFYATLKQLQDALAEVLKLMQRQTAGGE